MQLRNNFYWTQDCFSSNSEFFWQLRKISEHVCTLVEGKRKIINCQRVNVQKIIETASLELLSFELLAVKKAQERDKKGLTFLY